MDFAEFVEHSDMPEDMKKYARRFTTAEPMWKNCERADWMLWMLERMYTGDLRKLRLFTCRCARRWWAFLTDPRSQRALNAAEGFAVGKVSRDARDFMMDGAEKAALEAAAATKPILSRAARLVVLALHDDVLESAKEASRLASQAEHAINETQSYEHELEILAEQADYLRDVLGNPFIVPGTP